MWEKSSKQLVTFGINIANTCHTAKPIPGRQRLDNSI